MNHQIGDKLSTIIIGAGGLGKEIVKRLKQRHGEDWHELKSSGRIQILAVDYESVNIDLNNYFLDDDEKFSLKGEQYIRNFLQLNGVKNMPEIASWLSPEVRDRILSGNYYSVSTEMDRQVGRLSFFLSLNSDKEDGLSTVLKKLLEKSQGKFTNIIILSSTSGGTGSAIVIDTAYILRELAKNIGIGINITGIFLMPELIDSLERDYLEANTYAFLEELEYFQAADIKNRVFAEFKYPGAGDGALKNVSIVSKPFDQVYLISNITNSWRKFPNEKIFYKILDFIELSANQNIYFPLLSKISYIKELKNIRIKSLFSSFGITTLNFPVEYIVSWLTNRLLLDYINQILESQEDNGFDENLFKIETWNHEFQKEEIMSHNDIENRLKKVMESIANAINRVSPRQLIEDRNKKIQEEIEEKLKSVVRAKFDEIENSLKNLVRNALSPSKNISLTFTLETLLKYRDRLSGALNSAKNDIKKIEESIEEIEKELYRIDEKIKRGPDTNITEEVGRNLMKQESEREVKFFERIVVQTLINELYTRLIEKTEYLISTVSGIIKTLKNGKRLIEKENKKIVGKIESFELVRLIFPEDFPGTSMIVPFLEGFYIEQKPLFLEAMEDKFSLEDIIRSEGDMLEIFKTAIADSINPVIKELTIFDWLRQLGVDFNELIYRMYEHSSFLLPVRDVELRTYGVNPKEVVAFIGGGTEDDINLVKEAFDELRKDTEIFNSEDTLNISLLRMYHGFRIKDVIFVKNYSKSYLKLISQQPPVSLHIFPEFSITFQKNGVNLLEFLWENFIQGKLTKKEDGWVIKLDSIEIEGENILDLIMKLKKNTNIIYGFQKLSKFKPNKRLINKIIQNYMEDVEHDVWFEIMLKKYGSK